VYFIRIIFLDFFLNFQQSGRQAPVLRTYTLDPTFDISAQFLYSRSLSVLFHYLSEISITVLYPITWFYLMNKYVSAKLIGQCITQEIIFYISFNFSCNTLFYWLKYWVESVSIDLWRNTQTNVTEYIVHKQIVKNTKFLFHNIHVLIKSNDKE
jgi:hypothetical protein